MHYSPCPGIAVMCFCSKSKVLLVLFHRPGCCHTEGFSDVVVYPVLASYFFASSCNSRQSSQSLVLH